MGSSLGDVCVGGVGRRLCDRAASGGEVAKRIWLGHAE